VTIKSICDIFMKIVMLQMVSIFKEMLVARLKVLYQNSPEEAEEDDKNCVRITDNAVDIQSQYLYRNSGALPPALISSRVHYYLMRGFPNNFGMPHPSGHSWSDSGYNPRFMEVLTVQPL
jgi:hypothetical protein